MITPCPHCQTEIEIDAQIHAALAGQSHFACPTCQAQLPVPPGPSVPGASRKVAAARAAQAQSGHRNLLILGTVALLAVGSIGIYLASQKPGDTTTVNRNIRNEIINNSYFQNLIATGAANMSDLETMADIRAYGDGFIGASTKAMTWDAAVALAKRTGSMILDVEETGDLDGVPVEKWLSSAFSSYSRLSFWVQQGGQRAAFGEGQSLATTHKDDLRRVMLGWAVPPAVSSDPASSAPTVPPAVSSAPASSAPTVPPATTPALRKPARMLIQTYSIPIEQWLYLSPMLAGDQAALFEKLESTARDGGNKRLRRIDRIGGNEFIYEDKKLGTFRYPSMEMLAIPETFHAEGGNLVAGSIHHKNFGSEFISKAFDGEGMGTSGLSYTYIAKPPKQIPMLAAGTPDQMRISEVPVFQPIRLNTSIPTGRTGAHLMGAIPMGALGERPDNLAMVFTWSEQEEVADPLPSITVEFILLRGRSGIPLDQVSTQMKSMATARGGIEAVTALGAMAGGKAVISGETEWPFPTEALMTGGVLVPMNLEEAKQGTSLEIKCHAANSEGADVEFLFEHDLRKPSFPVASPKGPPYLEPATITLFRITHMERRRMTREWSALKEFPLGPILGTKDAEARGKSCYLFARVISSQTSAPLSRPDP